MNKCKNYKKYKNADTHNKTNKAITTIVEASILYFFDYQ